MPTARATDDTIPTFGRRTAWVWTLPGLSEDQLQALRAVADRYAGPMQAPSAAGDGASRVAGLGAPRAGGPSAG